MRKFLKIMKNAALHFKQHGSVLAKFLASDLEKWALDTDYGAELHLYISVSFS